MKTVTYGVCEPVSADLDILSWLVFINEIFDNHWWTTQSTGVDSNYVVVFPKHDGTVA